MHKIKVEQFEGPLDLLLQLIEENKLNITQLSLAHVTDQYINMLYQGREHISASELADFLLIAAKLLVIKSKALLPYLHIEDEEESDELENQLKLYKEFFEASKKIAKVIARKNFSFSRQKLFVINELGFQPPQSLKAEKLAQILREFLHDLRPAIHVEQSVVKKTINIAEKIQHIRELVFGQISLNFKSILKRAKDKTEIIVSFLALLELTKQKEIVVRQGEIFQDIIIEKEVDNI